MPKIKTHRGLSKRVKITGTGKVKRTKAYHSHLLSSKGPKRKRRLSRPDIIHPSDAKRMKRLVPYLI